MRVYISGPITGVDNYQEAFNNVEKVLEDQGYEPVNMAKIGATYPKSYTRDDYMKIDLAILETCDAVYFMPGWSKSRGCCEEYTKAVQLGLAMFGCL